jgi:fumarate reductase flavoprotein subunit
LTLQTKQLESNLVIIGGGGAGLSAALTAAENGLTGIVVLEKRGGLGGNTARATGLFACESPTQNREKIIADKDDLFKKAMNWAHWSRVDPRIIRAFLNKCGDTIRWLESKGIEFHVIAFYPNQEPRVEHVAKGKGAEITQVLAQRCEESGVQLMLHCSGTNLLFGDSHVVSGVSALHDDDLFEIKTRSVIISTGGFGGNKELLKKYCPFYYEGLPVRGLPLMGDGLHLAYQAGAAIEDQVTMLKEGPRVDLNTWPLGGLERDPVTLWINKRGKRFTDEAMGLHPFEAVNAVLRQPDKVCYSLLDNKTRQTMEERNPGLGKALQLQADNNRVKISGSWDEIAGWIGADPQILKTTVEEYNAFCQCGYDQLFDKERRFLWALNEGPYYAIRGLPHLLDTIGGIKINANMEVLNYENDPISGIFAAGVITSGWESETYCSDLSGSAFGYAISSGRIAGENAAKFILGEAPRR